LKERADNAALGKGELKRRLKTHLVPYEFMNVGYDGMSDDERRARVRSDYEKFLNARAEILAKAVCLACEGKALDLAELFGSASV
jgi:hypothetical protein